MSYAGMATNVVGGELQGWAAVLAQQAMNDAFDREMQRQGRFRQAGATQLFDYLPSLGSEAAQKSMDAGAQKRVAGYNSDAYTPMVGGGREGMSEVDRAKLGAIGQARAKLGGVGDWQTGQSFKGARLGDLLNRVVSLAQGQAQVFPYRMSKAQHSQDMLVAIGKGISSIGGGAADYASMMNQNGGSRVGGFGAIPATGYNPNVPGSGYFDYNPPSYTGDYTMYG